MPLMTRPLKMTWFQSMAVSPGGMPSMDIERLGFAHFCGQAQPVIVDVRDHDVARAAVARDGHRHDTYGTGAGDEHILADDVEGERRVRGIAEWIQDGGDFIVDGV